MRELVIIVSFEMDLGCKLLVLVFTLLRLSRMVASSDDCLYSRLEVYPCYFRFPELTQMAGPNQYGVYTTALEQNNVTGRTICVVRKRDHEVAAIPSQDNGTFFEIKSPKKYKTTSDVKYKNNLLAIYNVSCPAKNFIYINVSDMSLDDSTCDDPRSNSTKCVDYLQIRNAAGIVLTEMCGNGRGELNVTESSVEIIFRTDYGRAADGFSATVRCYNPSMCIQIQQRRSRASVETLSQSCPEAFSEKIEVPFGHSLYKVEEPEHQSLVLVEGSNVKATWPYERPLQQLLYYSMNGRMNEFRQEVSSRGQNARDKTWFPSPLKGPGTLYLLTSSEVSRACYQDYSEIIPNKRQKQQINQISSFMRFMHKIQHYARSSGLHQSDVDSESYIEGDTVTSPLASHSKLMNSLTSLEKVLLKHLVRKMNNLLKEASTRSGSCNPILETYRNMYKNTVKKIKLD